MNDPPVCRFVLSILYCTVPFVDVAMTCIDPLFKLHPVGSIFVHEVIVTTLVDIIIVSEIHAMVHQLYDPVTVYTHPVSTAIVPEIDQLFHK